MNYKSLSYIPLLAIAVMSSCSNDNELNSTNSEYVNSVRVTVEDFQPESTTRTAYTVDNSGFHFQWVEGDALGIYPVGGDQVKFPISSGDGSSTATFDGGAWKLRSQYQYAAYYPFSVDNYKIAQTSLPVSFTGQTQNGNGSTVHLGAYDYLACAATAPNANGGVDLTMKHLGAFLRLQLTMPKADTFSSVILESDGAKFVTTGTFDLTAATPAITPTATSSTYTINLTNIATTEKNQVITVYAIVAPANLSTSNITITVHGTGQTTYVQTVPGKKFVARSAYNIDVEKFPSGTNASGENVSWEESSNIDNGHEWVDLGLPSGTKWATCNIGASSPGDYGKFYAWGQTTWHSQNTVDTYEYYNKNIAVWDISATTYDIAYTTWGKNWCIPSSYDFNELKNRCTWVWTSEGSANGFKITGPNGKSIFLPACGFYNDDYYQITDRDEFGRYWACDSYHPQVQDYMKAYGMQFYHYTEYDEGEYILHEQKGWITSFDRYQGHSIRPIYNKN